MWGEMLMNRRKMPVLVLIAALLAGGCQPARRSENRAIESARVSLAQVAVTLAAGTTEHTLTVDGLDRTFRVYRPTSLPSGTPVPLVVMMHGVFGDGAQAQSSYGWDAVADREGFIVAYPDGIRRAWAVSEGCCGPPAATGVDDVAFISELVGEISSAALIDPARVYATGISNGGALAYRLACETTLFAAIAPVSGTLLGTCETPSPASLIHIHGTADRTFPYDGSPGRHYNDGSGAFPANTDGPPIAELAGTWRRQLGCQAPVVTTAGVVTTSAATCPEGDGVTLVTIAEAGHQWPGHPGPSGVLAKRWLDPPSMAMDATAAIYSFFDAHTRS